MKIAVIDPLLFTLPYDKALCRGLTEGGHQVLMIGRKLRADEAWDGSYGAYCELIPDPHSRWPSNRLLQKRMFWIYRHFPYLRSLAVAGKALWAFRPDIVHFQWTLLPVFDYFLVKFASVFAVPVFTMHDSLPSNGDKTSRSRYFGEKYLLACFRLIVVHTAAGRDRLVTRGVPKAKIARIPHGLLGDIAAEHHGGREFGGTVTFLTFGIVKPYKGIDVLIRAVARMRREVRSRCRFIVAGRGDADLISALKLLAAEREVQDLFEFRIEFVPDEAIADLFGSADVLVYPYREIEASGSLMLGLKYGVPVVASSVGVFREILLDNIHGRLVESENEEELAIALEYVANDDAFRKRAADNVKNLSERIPTWAEIADKTVCEYRKLIECDDASIELDQS